MDKILGIGDLTSVDTWRGVVAETIGVLVLVLVGTGTIIASGAVEGGALNSARLVAIALGLGFTYMALVALTVGISGGHINPAVTFGAVVTGRMGVAKGVVYVAGQVVGAIIASYVLKVVLTDAVIAIEGSLGAVAWNAIAVDNLGSALIIELILGFVLVFVMLAAVIGPGESASPMGPMAVGLIVVVGTLLGFALTGAAMNPARALGPAVAADLWTDHWIYWAGPLGGAVVAGIIYDGVFTGRLWGKK
jgi:aquaporin TIP